MIAVKRCPPENISFSDIKDNYFFWGVSGSSRQRVDTRRAKMSLVFKMELFFEELANDFKAGTVKPQKFDERLLHPDDICAAYKLIPLATKKLLAIISQDELTVFSIYFPRLKFLRDEEDAIAFGERSVAETVDELSLIVSGVEESLERPKFNAVGDPVFYAGDLIGEAYPEHATTVLLKRIKVVADELLELQALCILEEL